MFLISKKVDDGMSESMFLSVVEAKYWVAYNSSIKDYFHSSMYFNFYPVFLHFLIFHMKEKTDYLIKIVSQI